RINSLLHPLVWVATLERRGSPSTPLFLTPSNSNPKRCIHQPVTQTISSIQATLIRSFKTRRLALSISVALLLALVVWNAAAGRRIWTPAEVPIAFWSWRLETPSETDVTEAIRQTGTKTLFLRAGQIDYNAGRPRRIRPVSGSLPSNIAIHLVYTDTRSFLKGFEQIRADVAGATILAAFENDLDLPHIDSVQIVGLQLDFDVPTRLLPHYAAI